MQKKKLKKNIKKSITHSFGRFISIMLLMALGAFALVGLAVTGPDMRATGTTYFKKYNTADITILSDYGIDKSEEEYISKVSNIKEKEYLYLKDVVVKDTNTSFRIFSKPENISKYELVEGTLPEKDDEIAISNNNKEKYKIGDIIEFTEKENAQGKETLKRHEFKICGYINSSEIISDVNMGQTIAGTGELNGYAITNADNFDSDVYMMAKLVFADTQNLNPYSDEYNEKIRVHKEELENLLSEQQDIRMSSIKSEYQEKIDEGQSKLDQGKQELEDARTSLEDAKNKIENAKNEIAENEQKLANAQKQINEAESKIASNEKLLKQKQSEYNKGKQEVSTKTKEYETQKSNLEQKEKPYNESKNQLDAGFQEIATKKQQLELVKDKYGEEFYNQQLAILNATQTELENKSKELQSAKSQIDEAKAKLQSAKSQIDAANSKLNSGKQELDKGNKELQSAKTKLTNSKKEYNTSKQKLANAKTELASKEEEYNSKKAEFDEKEPEAQKEIEENEKKLQESKEDLESLATPTYSVDNRRELPGGDGYSVYETVSQIVDSLAKVFPVFLYFVAALVTLTTMTRFVSEERVNNGTLKSLGYDDKDIIKKFTIYGLTAGTTGTILGITLGHTLLPYIVYNAYKHGFTLPTIEMHFYLKITIISIIASWLSSVVPAFIVAKKDLQETTASLLQPKSPKAGSKILLERIKPIWNKLKFTQKVTARNLFRYKSRMFMTIFGVAGAASILFAGFSVQASISGINERQFKTIIKYNAIVALNDKLNESEKEEINKQLNSDEINSYAPLYYEEVSKIAGRKNDKQSIKLIVPEDKETFEKYITLLNRKTGEKIILTDNGVVISERLANLLKVSIGDTITFTDSNDKERTAKVDGICEMYAGHFIFMNTKEYENIYGKTYETNANLLLLKDTSLENTKIESAKFMNLSGVKGVVQNTTLYNQIDTIVNSLDKIMVVLIIVATMLAVVILYNLTNINVEERIRELCTIKVLGFYDKETTMYIYRETIILSTLGVGAGWLIGMALHYYILNVVPPDQIMFDPALWVGAFAIPAITVAIVTFVLKYYINRKLKNVDMLEALKSVD